MQTRYFSYIANKIAAAKLRADVLAAGVDHHGIEGEIREIAARDCIEPFLTQSFQCANGKIIDSLNNLSGQIDLIVYHKKVVPPILVNGDLGFFPVECVRYAFEIKSKLTATEVKDANKKFRSVGRLAAFPKKQADGTVKSERGPATVLFAFGSDIAGSEVERYLRHTEDEHPPCNVLCVLGKGYWFHNGKSWYGTEVLTGLPAYAEFCMFIIGLMNTLAADETSLIPFNPGAYVDVDGVTKIQVTATSGASSPE